MWENITNAMIALKDSLAKFMYASNSEMNGLIDQLLNETKIFRMHMKYTRIYGKKSRV